jgi:hypothetical protein
MSYTPLLERINFPEHYSYTLVQAGETKEVYRMRLTGGFVAFIERIACDFIEGSNPPTTKSTIAFIVDGFSRKFDYEIQINKPYVFDKPLVARREIRWLITNNDVPYQASDGTQKTGGHFFGVLCDGILVRVKESS